MDMNEPVFSESRKETAALIVAAGMSSRMGDFKPMLNIGSISIAERVVATFQQAGIEHIIMVTGYNATTLERHLSGNGIVFLRNEQYETTQMFESACIGLSYLKDKCHRILFTPVDIPLFTASTVETLLASNAPLACPVCEGKEGHPLLLSSSLVDSILSDSGEDGLRGALRRCGKEMLHIPVNDPGVLHDADTPKDYEALLAYHNRQLIRPVVTVSLAREKVFFEARTAMLLRLVDETQSVRTACQRMQMSYSSSWNLIRALESQLNYPLLTRSQGGAGGGKSELTQAGKDFLNRFEAYTSAVKESATELYSSYFPDLQ
ncbi:MAG: NTP transferase domain-containing protein [Lachnospiraceae bacterium]|nr:NTP transferase domain-containing protein [Lachnospiraceae bacterium]